MVEDYPPAPWDQGWARVSAPITAIWRCTGEAGQPRSKDTAKDTDVDIGTDM